MIELTTSECDYLLELLANAHKEMLHELHHSRTHRFEDSLRDRVTVNEQLTHKLETATGLLRVTPDPFHAIL